MNEPATLLSRGVERVRHELKFRILDVVNVERLSPRMVRVSLSGEDLRGFVSAAYDDHVKLFFPEGGAPAVRPEPSPNGMVFPDGQRSPARDYTPRRFDAAANRLDIDFVIHGDGPASLWAEQAAVGQTLAVGGPRGSFVVTGLFDWFLLVGDETSLPAIGRRLEELPAGVPVIALIEIADAAEEQPIAPRDGLQLRWLHRNGAEPGTTDALAEAVEALTLPTGEGYCFVAGETAMSKRVRTHLVEQRGLNPDWIKAAGYWQRHASDFDDGHAH